MPKDYFNDPIEKETGQSFKASPQALMFERLVSELQATLEEEVFFDDSDWPHGFDWSNEADAVWEGLAEDATLLAKFRTRSPADQVLCRAAGLIYRAICAESPIELEAVCRQFAEIMKLPVPAHAHFLLEEAQNCLQQMGDRAETDDHKRSGADQGPALEA